MFGPRSKFLPSLVLVLLASAALRAQPNLAGAAEIRLALQRMNVLGSVLMIGAHPDDEHTATLAWLARGRLVRAGYLSLTRGEGGQNLIGPEQGDLLGVIRTQELLAARRIDGAEQFFTRAIDFGFTKNAEETFAKWGREEILSDVVWIVRSFRPDVIVLCFSGTPRDGHGQHQASAILGKEAFLAAADRKRFPEQLKWVEPWQARRVLWNVYGRGPQQETQLTLDTGEFNPVLGHSYSEIAGMSRSMHRSQAMGSPERRGAAPTSLVTVAGEPAGKDLFDGIDLTWNRVPGGAEAGRRLAAAESSFDAGHPEKSVPLLLEARTRLLGLEDFWARRKMAELNEAIALCAGLWLDANAERPDLVPGASFSIALTALNRSRVAMKLKDVWVDRANGIPPALDLPLSYNQPQTRTLLWTFPAREPYSQPYWLVGPHGDVYDVPSQRMRGLAENPPLLRAHFEVNIGGQELDLTRPVLHRYVDRSRGELTRPLAVVPPVAVQFSQPVVVLPSSRPRKLEVVLKSNVAQAAGAVRLEPPPGWTVTPEKCDFHFAEAGEEMPLAFELRPPEAAARGTIRAVASIGEQRISSGMTAIAYPHIKVQTVFPPAAAQLVRADIRVLARRLGYVMGSGDEVPEALRQLGCEVRLLSAADLASADLSQFDAIVTGVRAYNVRPDLRANEQRLLEYVRNGGTLVVQYNTLEYGSGSQPASKIGPYPLRLGRDRVSVEEAPVAFPTPDSPLLKEPNPITAADFEGWVQERGLYFAAEWDPHYQSLFESHDPGEPAHAGGTLYTRYGQGAYVFTAYSWFRELPAGVPGAFRIFANLLSAGKVLR